MNEQLLRMRIQDVLALKHYSITRLAGVNGAALQVKLNNQISKTTTISASTILLVLQTFPDISCEWLLRGEGGMLKTEQGSNTIINNAHAHVGTANAGSTVTTQDYDQIIKAKDEMIAELRKDKENLMTLLTTITNK